MTILFASCLESFGLHPVLLTAPGHIFAGVWLEGKQHLNEAIISDAKLISKYIKENKLVALECTAMNVGKDLSCEEAKDIANKVIDEIIDKDIKEHECIDVQIVREIGVRPLPIRRKYPDFKHNSETFAQTKTEGNNSINEKVQKYIKENYVLFERKIPEISSENFYDKECKRCLKELIVEIVDVEGPISQPELIKTIIHSTNLGRSSKQIIEYLDKLVAVADVKITRQNGVRYLWKHNSDPTAYTVYRTMNQRNLDDICKYEVRNAICCLIQENGPMDKGELTWAMVNLLGYSRMSKKIEETVGYAIKSVRELKSIEQNSEGKYELKK